MSVSLEEFIIIILGGGVPLAQGYSSHYLTFWVNAMVKNEYICWGGMDVASLYSALM